MLLYNVVEYFVLYYDYYQLEVYIVQIDIYIEKDSFINDDVEWLWYFVILVLLLCCDVVVVVLVFCIYGLGILQFYLDCFVELKVGEEVLCDGLLWLLVDV